METNSKGAVQKQFKDQDKQMQGISSSAISGTVSANSSLLGHSVLISESEKHLQIAKLVREQLGNELPKSSHLRMISATWLDSYFKWIDFLQQPAKDENGDTIMSVTVPKPGPIINFDLLDLEPEYASRMHEVLDNQPTDQKDWCSYFSNWEYMTLKEDLEIGKDFYYLTHQIWMKLIPDFGGAPEIPIFSYNTEKKITDASGGVLVEKDSQHDFKPVKVRFHQVNMQGDLIGENFTMLISRFMTVTRFNQYIGQVRKDCNLKQKIFVIRPKMEGLGPIYEAPTKSTTFAECGVENCHDIVIVQADEGEINFVDFTHSPGKKHTFYHAVARHFDIPRDEYIGLLPELDTRPAIPLGHPSYASPRANTNAQFCYPNPAGNQYQQLNSDIPAEYEKDPDLYRAIQASLGEDTGGGQPNNADLQHVRMGGLFRSNNTGSTADDVMYNEGQSFDTDKLHHGDDKIEEFGPKAPPIQQSGLNVIPQKQQKTKTQYAQELREQKAAKFEAMRNTAKEKMKKPFCMSQMQKGTSQMRGQLGQPFRQFVDISNNMGKLKSNIDLILKGQMSLAELEELPCESEALLQGDRSEKSPMKQTKASLLINCNNQNEIDTECKTEEDEDLNGK